MARPSSAFRRGCHGRQAQGGLLDRGLRDFDCQRLICVVDWISAAIAWECIVPDIPISPFQAAHGHESGSGHNSPVEMIQPVQMQPEAALLARARQLGALPRRVFISSSSHVMLDPRILAIAVREGCASQMPSRGDFTSSACGTYLSFVDMLRGHIVLLRRHGVMLSGAGVRLRGRGDM